jgi:hypothetical protein
MTSLEDQIAMNYPQLVASFLDIFWLVSSYNSARQVSWLRSFPMIYGGICGLGTNHFGEKLNLSSFRQGFVLKWSWLPYTRSPTRKLQ